MPHNLAIQAMGDWGLRLLDGLLAGGQDASLERWTSTRQIHISVVAPSCAFSWWGSLLMPTLTRGTERQLRRHFEYSLRPMRKETHWLKRTVNSPQEDFEFETMHRRLAVGRHDWSPSIEKQVASGKCQRGAAEA
eukprot:1148161-Pelagomonas_calceolata.AAC.12